MGGKDGAWKGLQVGLSLAATSVASGCAWWVAWPLPTVTLLEGVGECPRSLAPSQESVASACVSSFALR